MDYEKKKSEYVSRSKDSQYYIISQGHKEEPKQNPTFENLFYNLPKGGSIASVPILHEGVVYFTSMDTYLYALNSDTGKMLWKYKTGDVIISAPTIHNNRIYFGSNDGNFYCLDMSGSLLWKKYLGDIIISYPTAIREKLFVSAGKNFFCLDENGRELWKFIITDGIFSVPIIMNDIVITSSYGKNIYALDLEGRLKWRFETGGIVSTPTVFSNNEPMIKIQERSWDKMNYLEDPMICFSCVDNNIYSIDQNGCLIWRTYFGNAFTSAVGGSSGVLYAGNIAGFMNAVDVSNGLKKWAFKTGEMISAAPEWHDGQIYFGSWDGRFYCLSENGEKIWDFLTGGPIVAECVINKDKAYFGSADTFFYCLNIKNRTVEWTFQCGFNMPDILKAAFKNISNIFSEYDKKIFKVWKPETSRIKTNEIDTPEGLSFEGNMGYKTTNAYKSDIKYSNKNQYKN